MTDEAGTPGELSPEDLSQEELEALAGEELPDREAMSILPIEPTGVPVPLDFGEPEPEDTDGKTPLTQ